MSHRLGADNCVRCTDYKLAYKSMHKSLTWILEYVGQHTEDFFPDGDANGDHSEADWFANAQAAVALADEVNAW